MTKTTHHTTTVETREGPVAVRVRRTTLFGERGWVFEAGTDGEWSEPTGPFATRAEAEEEGRAVVAAW